MENNTAIRPFNNATIQPHQYNSKEKQEDFELGWLDYGARMYSPDVPRWWVVDPLAEKYINTTPYAYCGNNPINYCDVDGRYYENNNAPTEDYKPVGKAKNSGSIYNVSALDFISPTPTTRKIEMTVPNTKEPAKVKDECRLCPTVLAHGMAVAMKQTFGDLGIHVGRKPPQYLVNLMITAPIFAISLPFATTGLGIRVMFIGFATETTAQIIASGVTVSPGGIPSLTGIDFSKVDIWDIGVNTIFHEPTSRALMLNTFFKAFGDLTYGDNFLVAFGGGKKSYDFSVDLAVGGLTNIPQATLKLNNTQNTVLVTVSIMFANALKSNEYFQKSWQPVNDAITTITSSFNNGSLSNSGSGVSPAIIKK